MIEIGIRHPEFKKVLGIKNNKRPNPHKYLLAEGHWEIKSALDRGVKPVSIYLCEELQNQESSRLANQLKSLTTNHYLLSKKAFSKFVDHHKPDGIAGLMPLPIRSINGLQTKNWKTIAIVDGLEIPGNAGTIIRSADGAGLDGLVFINRKFRLTHPKVLHASQGACFSMPIFDGSREEVFKVLDKIKANIFLGDSKANSFFHQKTYPAPCAIVLGSEKKGINTDWYQLDHKIIKIPMLGSCNSLNVACAATLLFYQTIKPSI